MFGAAAATREGEEEGDRCQRCSDNKNRFKFKSDSAKLKKKVFCFSDANKWKTNLHAFPQTD